MAYNGENRKIKANQTRQKIFESAAKLFSSNDYNEVSIDSIVQMAGVSKGSFYVHFSSKDALIRALINDQVKKADSDYKSILSALPDDVPAETVLFSIIEKITDVLIENIGCDKMRAVYKAQITKDFDTEVVTSYNREIYRIFNDVLERGIKRGEFKTDMPLEVLTRHLMMAIRGVTYEWCVRYPEFDYKAQLLQHIRLIMKGLRNSSPAET